MTLDERSEILPELYRLQTQLFLISNRAKEAMALSLFAKAQAALTAVNEAIEEFKPDAPSGEINFPTPKF